MEETELIEMIRTSSDPEKALEIAITLALEFLKRLEAPQCITPVTAQATA